MLFRPGCLLPLLPSLFFLSIEWSRAEVLLCHAYTAFPTALGGRRHCALTAWRKKPRLKSQRARKRYCGDGEKSIPGSCSIHCNFGRMFSVLSVSLEEHSSEKSVGLRTGTSFLLGQWKPPDLHECCRILFIFSTYDLSLVQCHLPYSRHSALSL